MSIKAYALSLPQDVGRRSLCETELGRLGVGFSFLDALPGSELGTNELQEIYDANLNRAKFKRPLSKNEIACTLGHHMIWQQIAESHDPLGLVIEDDATFLRDPKAFLRDVFRDADTLQDVMIKLNGVSRNGGRVVGSIADEDLVLSDRLPSKTTGYIIGRRAAARLLNFGIPIARPIDIDLKFYWEHNVPILTLGRPMVSERLDVASNIENDRQTTKNGPRLQRFIRNLVYQAKYTHGRLTNPLRPEKVEGLSPLLSVDQLIRKNA